MADLSSAPQDSVLRRHYESARLHALAGNMPGGIEDADPVPTDSVLRRHYEAARRHRHHGTSSIGGSAPPPVSNGQESPLSGQSAGPSTVRPAHAAIPRSTMKHSGGLLSALRRLFGGG